MIVRFLCKKFSELSAMTATRYHTYFMNSSYGFCNYILVQERKKYHGFLLWSIVVEIKKFSTAEALMHPTHLLDFFGIAIAFPVSVSVHPRERSRQKFIDRKKEPIHRARERENKGKKYIIWPNLNSLQMQIIDRGLLYFIAHNFFNLTSGMSNNPIQPIN